MKIMSIDLGLSRTGLAVCDEYEFLASPVCVLHEKDREKLVSLICEKAKQLNVKEFVLGLPRNMDGSEGQSAENARAFAKMLENSGKLKVNFWDERSTTVLAHDYLNTTNTRGKKRKSMIDSVSATIILQSYLDFRRNTAL